MRLYPIEITKQDVNALRCELIDCTRYDEQEDGLQYTAFDFQTHNLGLSFYHEDYALPENHIEIIGEAIDSLPKLHEMAIENGRNLARKTRENYRLIWIDINHPWLWNKWGSPSLLSRRHGDWHVDVFYDGISAPGEMSWRFVKQRDGFVIGDD